MIKGDNLCSTCSQPVEDSPIAIETKALEYHCRKNQKNQKKEGWLDTNASKWPASEKTIAAKVCIMNWMEEDPDTRIIVFTQHIPMIDLLAKIFHLEGWTVATYCGRNSEEEKKNHIEAFQQGKISILLATISSGGVGLNLTAGSRVLIVDPWWNDALLRQADSRIFRIGQQKDCHVAILIGEGSVEEYMKMLQHGKAHEIDTALRGATREASTTQKLDFFGLRKEDRESYKIQSGIKMKLKKIN
jgi:SNF2 family DNA or RNA helicase